MQQSLQYDLSLLSSRFRLLPESKNRVFKSTAGAHSFPRRHFQHLPYKVDVQLFLLCTQRLPLDYFLDDSPPVFYEVREVPFSAEEFQEDDTAAPDVLLVGLLLVLGFGSVEDGVVADGRGDRWGSNSVGVAKAHQFDENVVLFVQPHHHHVLGVDGLVRVPLLVAKTEGYKDLANNLKDGGQVVHLLLAEHPGYAFSGKVFEENVEEALLAEVLDNLDDVRVVEVLQDLHLLKGPDQVHLLAHCLYFADPLQPRVPFEDLPNDAGPPGKHF